ncbi:RHS repeat protein [Arenibacter sp. M-2]|uniref:RHS repeat domain-containing protein n=1 Tax=Arenibacter sp. M-2 TaxID=3053612 RepID=UPI002570368C|nr:RHS repeat domain-containing protein [Arenibacter sp. M-2]MDL5514707.1 RHS repeat protein [Arenibacter sp. M-2]
MMKIKLTVFLLILTFTTTLVYAQDEMDSFSDVIPPSPTAHSLGVYGQVPVGMFTGTTQFNIPIYELKSKKLSVPISLNYATNGVKVDQIASWVGMGWALNAGGVITRTVMDKKDEGSTRIPFNDIETLTDLSLNDMENLLFNISNPDSRHDTQPDIYTYNFNGQNGKFIIGLDGIIRTIPQGDLNIEVVTSVPYRYFIITTKEGIKYYFGEEQNTLPVAKELTQLRSNQCNNERSILEQYHSAWYLTRIVHPSGDVINLKYKEGIDLWTDYDAGISQTYNKGLYTNSGCSTAGVATTCVSKLSVRNAVLEEISTDNVKVKFNSTPREDIEGFKLDAVIIEKNGIVGNLHRFDLSYEYAIGSGHGNTWSDNATKRLFLKGISESGTGSNNFKKHLFDYYNLNELPERFSFSQDYWGYYNAANNGNDFTSVPVGYKNDFPSSIDADRNPNRNVSYYGTLKRITYPTGGVSMIEYEPHSYWGEVREYGTGSLVPYYAQLTKHTFAEHVYSSDTISIPAFPETMVFHAKLSCLDPEGNPCDTEEAIADVKIRTGTGTLLYTIYLENEYTGDAPDYNQWVPSYPLPGGDYIVDLHLSESSNAGKHFKLETWFSYLNSQTPITVEKNIETGGVRVKRITSKTEEHSKPEVTRYYYRTMNDSIKSTGTKPITPVNLRKITKQTQSNEIVELYDCDNYILSSSSINNIYGVDGYHIAYSDVLVSLGENFQNGGKHYKYKATTNTSGIVKNINGTSGPVASSVYSNTGWDAGLLLQKDVFKMEVPWDFTTLNREIYKYKKEDRVKDIVKGALLRQNYYPIGGVPIGGYAYTCKVSDVGTANRSYFYTCTTQHIHRMAAGFFWEGWRCFSKGANNVKIYRDNPCTYKQPGDIWYKYENLNNFDFILYDIIIEWQYLERKTTTQFDENGQNPITMVTDYEYSNPLHLQMTKSSIVTSSGSITTKKNYYPLDYDYENSTVFDPLLSNGQFGLPIEIRNEVDGKLSTSQLLKYNDKGQVTEIDQTEEEKGTVVPWDSINPYSYGEPRLKITYDVGTGNISSTEKDKGTVIFYLWAYNDQFPIAKIENAVKTDVDNALSTALGSLTSTYATTDALLTSLDDIQGNVAQQVVWRNFNTALRSGLSDAMLTTYTYDPLVGVTSITDPKGYTIYYSYDSFNRLKEVRDSEGNLVTDYEYYYKTK